jgi:adenosylmethionine-8-amino-7-oxononanoate aminotransferase
LPIVGDVRRHGMMAAIELVADRDTKHPFAWEDRIGARVCAWTTEHGVWLRPLGNVIPILPPLSMGDDDLRLLCETVGQAIRHVQA